MSSRLLQFVPLFVVLAALLALGHWFAYGGRLPAFAARVPNQDRGANIAAAPAPKLTGVLTAGPGTPAALPGAWPAFRGANHDNVNTDPVPLAREWPSAGPTPLWGIDLGEGYAGAVVRQGRVYVLDYDQPGQQDVLRCLSLADGKEIWHRAYKVKVKRNHGMSRTTAAVTEKYIVTLGPMCHVVCADAISGDFKWGIDLVRDYGATVPPWYAGQCPLIDGDRVILAPGGSKALLVAVDLATGKVAWTTPNPHAWTMTHSSLIPMDFHGRRTYVYCASGGVTGVDAATGRILWETPDWRVDIANVPTPVLCGDDRIFLSGGYNAGCMMVKLTAVGEKITPQAVFRLPAAQFGSDQQTPIFYKGDLYGVIPDGRLVCMDLTGKQLWSSGAARFGIGPYLIADGLIYLCNDTGTLTLADAVPDGYHPRAEAKVLTGHDAWGPMALVNGRLLLRDLTRMVCLDVARH